MPESTLINDLIRPALDSLSDTLVFRKLGICYDYRSLPDDFPSRCLPGAKETSAQKPDPRGSRTGMARCALNNALLFDGYALRVEIGFADPAEDKVFDRLIGGAIRLATIAPKGALINGLSPDGKSYYPAVTSESCVAWAFYAWRAALTSTVALESQEKLKNIAARWISRLDSDKFILPGGDTSLTGKDWSQQPLIGGIAAAAWALTGEAKWKKLAEENAVYDAPLPTEATMAQLLPAQLALHLTEQILTGTPAAEAAKQRQLALLPLAASRLKLYAGFVPAEKIEKLDWHDLPATAQEALPPVWKQAVREEETVSESVLAAYGCLLCHDPVALEAYVGDLRALVAGLPWQQLWLAASLCPAAAVHARGLELGLWDEALKEYKFGFDPAIPLVERYMSADYDEKNPEKAGHSEGPERPQEVEEGVEKSREGKRRRRRRKRR